MALLEKGIPFTTSYVNILNGKQFTKDFLSINPRGEVPVLVDDNTRCIPDSALIMDYLEDNFSNGDICSDFLKSQTKECVCMCLENRLQSPSPR